MADKSYKLTLSLSDGSIINAGIITAPQGPMGANGVTFTPSVSAAGVLSWTNNGGLTNPPSVSIKGPKGDDAVITESDVAGWGFTKNAGTITGIKMNGVSKGTSGVIDLGTVLTAHQDISGKANLAGNNTFMLNTGESFDIAQKFVVEDRGVNLDAYQNDDVTLMVGGNAGNAGQVFTSCGNGKTPTWTTPTKGTVTSVKINGSTKSPDSVGLVDLGVVKGEVTRLTGTTINFGNLTDGLYVLNYDKTISSNGYITVITSNDATYKKTFTFRPIMKCQIVIQKSTDTYGYFWQISYADLVFYTSNQIVYSGSINSYKKYTSFVSSYYAEMGENVSLFGPNERGRISGTISLPDGVSDSTRFNIGKGDGTKFSIILDTTQAIQAVDFTVTKTASTVAIKTTLYNNDGTLSEVNRNFHYDSSQITADVTFGLSDDNISSANADYTIEGQKYTI